MTQVSVAARRRDVHRVRGEPCVVEPWRRWFGQCTSRVRHSRGASAHDSSAEPNPPFPADCECQLTGAARAGLLHPIDRRCRFSMIAQPASLAPQFHAGNELLGSLERAMTGTDQRSMPPDTPTLLGRAGVQRQPTLRPASTHGRLVRATVATTPADRDCHSSD